MIFGIPRLERESRARSFLFLINLSLKQAAISSGSNTTGEFLDGLKKNDNPFASISNQVTNGFGDVSSRTD